MAVPGPGRVRNETIEVGTLKIEIERRSPVQVIVLRGELGIDEAPTLQAELQRALDSGSNGFQVDLSGLEFIDSTGLACLLRAVREAGARGSEPPVFRGAGGHVRRVLALTALDRVLPLSD
jgi:anti-anti-sigma factor